MVKNYLLDTNIILNSPSSIFGFEDNNVYITGTTLQELDNFKNAPGEKGYAARECCRILDELREQGDLAKGIKLPNGGTFYVEPDGVDQNRLPLGYSIDKPDNRIISTAIYLKRKTWDTEIPLILVTNDISMRVNAGICGLNVESYKNDHIEKNDDVYLGYKTIELNSSAMIDDIYNYKTIDLNGYPLPTEFTEKLIQNEYFVLKHDNQSTIVKYRNNKLSLFKEQTLFGGVKPKNVVQKFAIDALMAPPEEVPLVILIGPAGTAKTFLSLAAGLSQTKLEYGDEGIYRKILISRPNVSTMEKDFGYLPGDLKDKSETLLASYYDNLDSILRAKDKNEDSEQIQIQIDDMMENGSIEICPLHHIRGRSLQNSFIICDEAQNAPKQLVRDIITRAGLGSKVVLCGDINQVDTPTLDKRNNGLIYAFNTMKDSDMVSVIRFTEEHCVRSKLSELAIKRMIW